MTPSGAFHIFLKHRLGKAGSVGSAWGSRAVPLLAVPLTAALPLPEPSQGWVLGRAADKSQNAVILQIHLYSSSDSV